MPILTRSGVRNIINHWPPSKLSSFSLSSSSSLSLSPSSFVGVVRCTWIHCFTLSFISAFDNVACRRFVSHCAIFNSLGANSANHMIDTWRGGKAHYLGRRSRLKLLSATNSSVCMSALSAGKRKSLYMYEYIALFWNCFVFFVNDKMEQTVVLKANLELQIFVDLVSSIGSILTSDGAPPLCVIKVLRIELRGSDAPKPLNGAP